MPKPRPGNEPDPMARVVDRLLAQLPGLQADARPSSGFRAASGAGTFSEARQFQSSTPEEAFGAWVRVILGSALGTMMLGWPYAHDCGLALAGYLCAVTVVMLAGVWAAMSAWRLRAALPHILSLILLFWGIVLAAEQVLPRVGYAVDQAAWQCREAGTLDQSQRPLQPEPELNSVR